MITVDVGRLPLEDEYPRARHLILHQPHDDSITDDDLAKVFGGCPHLETVSLSGLQVVTDKSLMLLAKNAMNLQEIDLTGCTRVTDVGVLELASKSLPLRTMQLNGVTGITDPSVSAIAKGCSPLVELGLCDLPLISPLSIRDVWSYSRKLRTLRLARCPLLTNTSFPSVMGLDSVQCDSELEKPLPPRPVTWLETLPPLILRHSAENLRVLDLTSTKVTDAAIEGIVTHAPKIQSLILSGCIMLTDRAVEEICKLGDHLDVLMLAHVAGITDRAIVKLARSCANLRCVNVAFCRNLTDLSVFELAALKNLRRLTLVRVHKLTDIALFSLAEHAGLLERIHLSYCDRLSLQAIHLLLRKLNHLDHLTATGIPSCRRRGVRRFSDAPPEGYNSDQRRVFRAFTGENVIRLRKFLDKEERRQHDAEAKNISFVARSDDKLDLY